MKRYRFEAIQVDKDYLFRFKETNMFINSSNFLIRKADFIELFELFSDVLKPYTKGDKKDIYSLEIEISEDIEKIPRDKLEMLKKFMTQMEEKGIGINLDTRYLNDEVITDFDLEDFLGFFLIKRDEYDFMKKSVENCNDCIVLSISIGGFFSLSILEPQKILKKIEEEFNLPSSFKIIDITPDIRYYYPVKESEEKNEVEADEAKLELQKELEKIKQRLIANGAKEEDAEKQAFDIFVENYRKKREFEINKTKIKQKLLKGVPKVINLLPFRLFYNLTDTITIPIDLKLEKDIVPIYLRIKLKGQAIWDNEREYFIAKDRYIDAEDVRIYTKRENKYIDITDLFKSERGATFKDAAWRLFDYYMIINDNLYKKSKKVKIIIDSEWKEKIIKQINLEFLNLKVSPKILKKEISQRFNNKAINELPYEYDCFLTKLDYKFNLIFNEDGNIYPGFLIFEVYFDELDGELENYKLGLQLSFNGNDAIKYFDIDKLINFLDIDVDMAKIPEKTKIKFNFCEEFLEKCKIKNLMKVVK